MLEMSAVLYTDNLGKNGEKKLTKPCQVIADPF